MRLGEKDAWPAFDLSAFLLHFECLIFTDIFEENAGNLVSISSNFDCATMQCFYKLI